MGISLESREVTNHNGYLDVVCGREYTPTGERPFCFKGKWNERVLSPCRERSCEISRIPNGVLTVRRLGPPYFTFSGWVRDDYYDEIPLGTEISSGHMRHLTCFDGYSVQGSGSSVLAVTCQKGEWYPNPVCLPHGMPYVEAVVTAVSTLKPSAPKTVAVAEVSSTETNLKLSKTTTQPPTSSSTDGKEVDQPHTVSVAENNNVAERCSCKYNSPDKNLVAYAGNELLQNGNHVKSNCTVKFHCKEIGYYRLTGPKEITCTDCRPFHSAAYPECKEPVHGDTAIFFDENLKVMPDGTLSLIKGVTVRLTCLGNIRYPTWTFPESENTHTHYEAKNTDDGIVYTTLLDIVEASSEHDGKYNCAMEGYAPTTINIKVFDPDMRCPLLEEGNKFIIEYDRDRLPNSTAKFDCKKLGQKIIGANVLTCLMDGHWSAETPDCTEIRCPAFKESEDMLIEYTAEQRPGSVATFFCGKGDVYGTSKCLETGDWSASMPSCSRKEVLCPTLDETKFQVVYDGERKVDSQAKISCLTTLQKLNGSDVLRCLENGRWSHVPDCIDIECPAFEENEDMQIQYTQDRKVGSSANFHCFSPAVLSGKSTLKCLSNGEWSGNTPSCLRPSCSLKSLYEKLPEKIVIGQDQPNNDIPYGTNIPLACDDGLRPEGKAEAKCEEDQKWTIPRVRCVSGCGPIPKADNSQLIIEPEKEFYVFGESVIFSCPTGHSLTSELQLVVCISNTWSADEFPDCKNV
ncbi:P-selectin-like isoform X3 [Stegodyphus dumicola]|uniref:P-selectin-like isoform X3 n=1 Tax=Stegodyphus dumicola TaxID=202533 RepID=UPI0015AE58B6|nr:P-selectin-like isoform X3 [Stegodyphus dumicola]